MNRIYRLIIDRRTNRIIVASENTHNRGKSTQPRCGGTADLNVPLSFAGFRPSLIQRAIITYRHNWAVLKPISAGGMAAMTVAMGVVLAPTTAIAQFSAGGGSATGPASIAIGGNGGTGAPSAPGSNSIAIGSAGASASGNSIAIGRSAVATTAGTDSEAIGEGATTSGVSSAAFGTDAKASGASSLAVGNAAIASNADASALGFGASAVGSASNAIGMNATASGTNDIAFGTTAVASGGNSIAEGPSATASGAGAQAFGQQATASGQNASAFGSNATASSTSSIAIGSSAAAVGTAGNSIAIGAGAISNGPGSGVALGTTSLAGQNAFAGGSGATATGVNSVALGQVATAVGQGAVALGLSSKAINANDVALGSNSVTAATVATNSATVGGATYSGFAGTSPTSTVSVGAPGAERTITNVAAGRVTATSTDAVNGSELFSGLSTTNNAIAAVSSQTANLGASTAAALGGGAAYNPATGVMTNPLYVIGGTTFNNVGSALTNLDGRTTQNATDITTLSGQVADGVQYDDGTHTSVTLGGVGATAPVALTNVAPGALSPTSTDAVNGAQLNTTNNNVTTVQNTVNDLQTGSIGIKYFHTNSALADSQATGIDAIAVGGNAQASAATSIALGANASASAANSIALGAGSVASVGAQTNYTAFGLAAPQTSAGEVNVGNRQVTGVAAGSVGTDAVNVNQLQAVSNQLGTVQSDALLWDPTANGGAGAYNANHGGTGPNKITNVAAGAAATDAVNFSQLQAEDTKVNNVGSGTAGALGGGATYDPTTGVMTNPSYAVGGSTFNNVGSALTNLDGRTTQNATDITTLSGQAANGVQYDDGAHTSVTLGGVGATAPVALTNVAPGALSATSTDAVNGSQLNTTNQNVTALSAATSNVGARTAQALGSGATFDAATGTISAPAYTTFNADGTTSTAADVGTAIDNINSQGIKYFHTDSTLADASATGTDAVAIGPAAVSSGASSFAAGNGAQATTDNALALGALATASVNGGVALGQGSVSNRAVVPSSGTIGSGSDAVPFNTSDGTLLGAVSVGNAATNSYRQLTNVADGTAPQDAVTVRQLTGALSSFAVAGTEYFHANSTGQDALAVGAESVAVGPATVVNGDNGVGIGNGAVVNSMAPGGIAIGEGANSNLADAIALGSGATANGAQSIAQGANANAALTGGVALGSGASSSAVDALALGAGASASSAGSVALGAGSITTANLAAAAFNPGAGVLGGTAPVGEISVGSASAERRITNVAAGAASTDAVNVSQLQSEDGKVNNAGASTAAALGGGATYSPATGTISPPSYAVDGTTFNNVGSALTNIDTRTTQNTTAITNLAGQAANGVQYDDGTHTSVTLGGTGGTAPVTLTNVAPGALTTTSTDAVNGAQLNATNQNVTNVQNQVDSIDSGAGITYFRANSTLADASATGANAVAIGPLAVSSGADALAVGNGAQAQANESVALGAQASTSVDGGVALGAGSLSDRAVAPGSGMVSGSLSVPFNTSDRTLLGAISVGNATTNTYRQITNVADGTQQQDAVTVRQLTGALASFAVTGTEYFHVNSAAADSLAVGAESVAVGPTTVVDGDNGVGIGNGAVVNSTAPGGIAIGEAASSNAADAIALGSGATANGAQSIAQGANASADQAGALAFGSGAKSTAVDAVAIGAGASASAANSVALGAGSATTVGAQTNYIAYGLSSPQTSSGEVNVGNRQITGVAAGSAPNDAVNVNQLDTVATNLTNLIGQANNGSGGSGGSGGTGGTGGGSGSLFQVNSGSAQSAPTPSGTASVAGGAGAAASGAKSAAIGNNSTASGDSSTALGNGATSSGTNSVAVGANSDDGGRTNVVSVGSVSSQRQVTNVAAGTQDTDAVNVGQLNDAVGQANTYTNAQISGLRSDLDSVHKDANAGTASAIAMANLPQAVLPGEKVVAMGGGTFGGESAMAVGLSLATQKWMVKGSVTTDSRGSVGAGAGVGYRW
jgi:trimeric autotransporter adhesin